MDEGSAREIGEGESSKLKGMGIEERKKERDSLEGFKFKMHHFFKTQLNNRHNSKEQTIELW